MKQQIDMFRSSNPEADAELGVRWGKQILSSKTGQKWVRLIHTTRPEWRKSPFSLCPAIPGLNGTVPLHPSCPTGIPQSRHKSPDPPFFTQKIPLIARYTHLGAAVGGLRLAICTGSRPLSALLLGALLYLVDDLQRGSKKHNLNHPNPTRCRSDRSQHACLPRHQVP